MCMHLFVNTEVMHSLITFHASQVYRAYALTHQCRKLNISTRFEENFNNTTVVIQHSNHKRSCTILPQKLEAM